mmetsp:Transcript_2204/g.3879  ORF Transcript_2204/g.3879 Transcript_2204/m.3879 type:complete len:164 (+) Transcript_2204:1455-1946(+)
MKRGTMEEGEGDRGGKDGENGKAKKLDDLCGGRGSEDLGKQRMVRSMLIGKEPISYRIPNSELMQKLNQFLPQMKSANEQLIDESEQNQRDAEIKKDSFVPKQIRDCEDDETEDALSSDDGESGQQIEMTFMFESEGVENEEDSKQNVFESGALIEIERKSTE